MTIRDIIMSFAAALSVPFAIMADASAAPYTFVSTNHADAFLSFCGNGACQQVSDGPGGDAAVIPQNAQLNTGGDFAASETKGTVSVGALRGFTAATINIKNADSVEASARAELRISWGDTLTLIGPAGGTGSFSLTLNLDSTMVLANTISLLCCGGNIAEFAVTLEGPGDFRETPGLQANSTNGGGSQSTTLFFTGISGTSLDLAARLFVNSSVRYKPDANFFPENEPNQSASIDAMNTATLFIDPLTPGFSISAESGHNYATAAPVPLPAAIWLLGTTLGGLGFINRRTGG